MNFRMKLGGGEKRHEESAHYTEGYNAGYNMAMDEMRRRTRGHDDYDEIESRRGRRSRSAMDDVHWPLESRQIGFTGHDDKRHHDDMESLMRMMDDIKEGQERIKQGLAASTKKLDPHMDALLETATGVLDNPPSTWESYIKRQDYIGIAKMEGKELLAALEAHKPMKDIRKELSHTLAALLQLTTAH